jgi:acyl carrier protein
MDIEQLMDLAKKRISEVVGLHPSEINEDESFLKMGIASIQAVKIINLMQKDLDMELNPAILFEYETLGELVDYFLENQEEMQNA